MHWTSAQAYLEIGTHNVKLQVIGEHSGATCPVELSDIVAIVRCPECEDIWNTIRRHTADVLRDLRRIDDFIEDIRIEAVAAMQKVSFVPAPATATPCTQAARRLFR